MAIARALLALAVLGWLPVQAQVVQDDWLAPSLPDGGTAVLTGTNYTIRWTANLFNWFGQYAPTADVNNVDLWFKSALSPHIIQIGTGVNVKQTLSYSWVVDVPSSALDVSTRWSFQFRAATPNDNDSAGEISSPQVVVREGAPTSTSSTVSSTTSASSTSTSSAATTPSAQVTSQTTPSVSPVPDPVKDSGISAGAIAGIVVGALAFILSAIGVFLYFRRRKANAPAPEPEPFNSPEAAIYYHTQGVKYDNSQQYPVSAGSPPAQYPASPPSQYPASPPSQYPVGAGTPSSQVPSHAVELPSNADHSPRELRGNDSFGRA